MLKILHPFGGSGSQVMKLIKTGAINQALQAYTSQPDAAGAVVLINHYAKRYICFHAQYDANSLLVIPKQLVLK